MLKTMKNIGKRMAVVFVEKNKEEVINIAVIREAFSKSFQIAGLNREEAQNLSILLRSGALSAPGNCGRGLQDRVWVRKIFWQVKFHVFWNVVLFIFFSITEF